MWIILNSNEIQNGQKFKLGWVFKETIGKICDTWVILNSDENKMAEKTQIRTSIYGNLRENVWLVGHFKVKWKAKLTKKIKTRKINTYDIVLEYHRILTKPKSLLLWS